MTVQDKQKIDNYLANGGVIIHCPYNAKAYKPSEISKKMKDQVYFPLKEAA